MKARRTGGVSEEQAFYYKVMFAFLDQKYSLENWTDLQDLLGSMQVGADGVPMDPAMWDDWARAVASIAEKYGHPKR